MIQVKIRRKPDRDAYQLYYVDPLTGAEKTKSAKTGLIREAERAAQRWEEELRKHGPASNPAWGVFRARFEDEVAIHQRPATRRQYKAAFDHWEAIVGKPKYVASIMPTDVSQFQSKLASKVASATVVKTLRHLRRAFSWAEKMGMIPRAPKVEMPKQPKRRFARARAVTEAEYKLLLKAIPQVRPDDSAQWKRLLEFLWLSGLRLDEALAASWESPPVQIDLDSARYPRIIFHAAGQKSGADEMWVMPPDMAAWLRRTPAKQRRGLVAPVIRDGISGARASHLISDIGKAAGVSTAAGKWASAHDFRRAFGTRWAKQVRPFALQKLMRHATIETTLAYYVDSDESAVGEELWRENCTANVPSTAPVGGATTKNTRRNKPQIAR